MNLLGRRIVVQGVRARAYPVRRGWDGQVRDAGLVWVEDGDGELVAHGFGEQTVRVPAGEIGTVTVFSGQQRMRGVTGGLLVVRDREDRVLLEAREAWDDRQARQGWDDDGPPGEARLRSVCRNLDLAYPGYLPGAVSRREVASWRRAPGYRRLRTGPGGPLTSRFAWVLLALVLGGLCITAGLLIAVALSGAIGTVDDMIGILLVVAGLWATGWFIVMGLRVRAWLRESLDRRRPAPPEGFFAPGRGWRVVAGGLLTGLLPLVIIMVAVFGPVIGLISLSDGFHDQALVSTLRQQGVTTTGSIVGDTEFQQDAQGNTDEVYTVWLEFQTDSGQMVYAQDPAINGWTWPVQPPLVSIVYLPSNPNVAAVAGQLDGSVWRGAVTGNLVSGAVLTIALVPLTWWEARRLRRAIHAVRTAKAAAQPDVQREDD